MAKLGFVVNPIAGMGGSVGLKGTDGEEILEKARQQGARPVTPARGAKALEALKSVSPDTDLLTYPGEMGEDVARKCGWDPIVLGSITPGKTTAGDTKRAVEEMTREKVDLVLFVGGDGTARDVLESAGATVPVLGVPGGVKIFSAVFANTPEDAGKLAGSFLTGGLPVREAEVMDVDEGAYRRNELKTDLKGYALVPYEPGRTQESKLSIGTAGSEEADKSAIAKCIVEAMDEEHVYIVGPGTTTGAILDELGIKGTLLGVDSVKRGKLLAADVTEARILEELEGSPGVVIVSPLGRQGFIFGRGNQQVSAKVIRKVGRDRIVVVATPSKLKHTPQLKVDTGDAGLDAELRGEVSVIVGYWLRRMVPVV